MTEEQVIKKIKDLDKSLINIKIVNVQDEVFELADGTRETTTNYYVDYQWSLNGHIKNAKNIRFISIPSKGFFRV